MNRCDHDSPDHQCITGFLDIVKYKRYMSSRKIFAFLSNLQKLIFWAFLVLILHQYVSDIDTLTQHVMVNGERIEILESCNCQDSLTTVLVHSHPFNKGDMLYV